MYEAVYADALTLCAMGETRTDTRKLLVAKWLPSVGVRVIDEVLAEVLPDALKQGVEREDIDTSWFAAAEQRHDTYPPGA